MPRGFTEKERELITEQLFGKGQELFASYGVRKTNVEDLTRAVGISKGAFYNFFNSKEELFMEIMERFEAQFRKEIMGGLNQAGESPRECFKHVMRTAFATWRTNPILQHFSQEDYQYLLRKLPAEKLQAHLQGDDAFVYEIVDYLKEQSVRIEMEPKIIAGLMKALFYVSFHAEEIGSEVYPQTMDLLIEMVANQVIKE